VKCKNKANLGGERVGASGTNKPNRPLPAESASGVSGGLVRWESRVNAIRHVPVSSCLCRD
jgi:hypothetical protein